MLESTNKDHKGSSFLEVCSHVISWSVTTTEPVDTFLTCNKWKKYKMASTNTFFKILPIEQVFCYVSPTYHKHFQLRTLILLWHCQKIWSRVSIPRVHQLLLSKKWLSANMHSKRKEKWIKYIFTIIAIKQSFIFIPLTYLYTIFGFQSYLCAFVEICDKIWMDGVWEIW